MWRCWLFGWDFLLMLSQDSEDEMWSRFMFELLIWLQEVTLARWTQPSSPLCLWQCFISIFLLDPKRARQWCLSTTTGFSIIAQCFGRRHYFRSQYSSTTLFFSLINYLSLTYFLSSLISYLSPFIFYLLFQQHAS